MSPECVRLVEENMRLPHFLARKYLSRAPVEYDDLIQEGMIGLMKAAQTFDVDKGVKFGSYAATCVLNEMRMAARKTRAGSRVPDRLKVPLDAPVNGNIEAAIGEIIPDPNVDVEAEVGISLELATAHALINILPYKERRALELHMRDDLTQNEIARIMGTSQSYASRLIHMAQSRLRAAAETTPDRRILMSRKHAELNFDVDASALIAPKTKTQEYLDLLAIFDRSNKPCAKVEFPEGIEGKKGFFSLKNAAAKYAETHLADIKIVTRKGDVYLVREPEGAGVR